MKACFVILHYIDIDTTQKCISSILQLENQDYSVVIVDNASPNNSGALLKKVYKDNEKVEVILLPDNVGYARGNNIGFLYAKEVFKAEYIIVANNDVIFEDSKILDKIQQIFEQTNAYIIGPDVYSAANIHQNPLRSKMLNEKKIKGKIRNKAIGLLYFRIKKHLKIGDKIQIFEKMYNKGAENSIKERNWSEEADDAVLQGACLIFTPNYVRKEYEAFDPRTFMYCEEELLALKCERKKYNTRYSPAIQVRHMDGKSTELACDGTEKNLFQFSHMLKGYKLILGEMKR